MRPTPHLIIASVAVVLALLLAVPRMGGTGLASGPFTVEPKVDLGKYMRPVIPVEVPMRPLISEPVELVEISDPFVLPQKNHGQISGGRLPPPPLFDLPEPPPMPLPEK